MPLTSSYMRLTAYILIYLPHCYRRHIFYYVNNNIYVFIDHTLMCTCDIFVKLNNTFYRIRMGEWRIMASARRLRRRRHNEYIIWDYFQHKYGSNFRVTRRKQTHTTTLTHKPTHTHTTYSSRMTSTGGLKVGSYGDGLLCGVEAER